MSPRPRFDAAISAGGDRGSRLWAFWWELASLVVRDHQVDMPGWPAPLSGLRIAVISDLHVGSPYNGLDRLRALVDATNAAEPDLILLAGDYAIQGVIGGSFVEPAAIAPELALLEARLGVYGLSGAGAKRPTGST